MQAVEAQLVEAVRELARTRFAERAEEHDRERSFPAQNIEDLRSLGVPGMHLDPKWGGLGMGVEALTQVLREIAYADGSTAIAIGMHLLISHFVSFFPPFPRQREVLEDVAKNGALICGPGSVPTAQLDNRTSGFQVSDQGDHLQIDGFAGFASNSEGATYALLGGAVEPEEEGGELRVAIAFPRLDTPGLTNLLNWNAMGMRGTASHDIRCEGVVVPKSEAFLAPASLMREGQTRMTVERSQQRSWGALGILAIWVGLSEAAFDATLDYVGKRHGFLAGQGAPGTTPGYRSEEAWAQIGIGSMEHWLGTGRTVFDDALASLEREFDDVQAFTRHQVRAVYHLRRMSEEIASGCMRVCGAHAYVTGRPLERIFRDLVGANVMAWKTDHLLHLLGMSALGQPITLVGPAGT